MNQNTVERRKTGLIEKNDKKCSMGYVLFATQTGEGLVEIINHRGARVHKWNMPVRPGRDAVLLPNGNLGYNGSHEKSVDLYPAWDIWHGGHFIEVNPYGKVIWQYEDPYHHHDALWMDNGNLLYTAAVYDKNTKTVQDVVKEVNREGEVIWEWKASDWLDSERFKKHECFSDDHWPMINGLNVTQDGNVLMSLRTTSGIICVDKKFKTILWTLEYPLVAQQHCPIELNNGNILCFDNGNLRPNSIHHSRIVEYNPKTKELVWSYVDPMPPAFFSPYMGSVQRTWNGNTFICESAFGRLFEVTPEGETVWEYVIPTFAEYPKPLNKFITGSHNSCFKAHHYEFITWLG